MENPKVAKNNKANFPISNIAAFTGMQVVPIN